jgi:hypothetical protein
MNASNRIKLRERMTHGAQRDFSHCPTGFLFPSRANPSNRQPGRKVAIRRYETKKPDMNAAKGNKENPT